jgi:hypothetical protein
MSTNHVSLVEILFSGQFLENSVTSLKFIIEWSYICQNYFAKTKIPLDATMR